MGALRENGAQRRKAGPMTAVAYEEETGVGPATARISFVFIDTGAFEIVRPGHVDDVVGWPDVSMRATTSATAQALERRTTPDPEPRLPDLEIADGLGL